MFRFTESTGGGVAVDVVCVQAEGKQDSKQE